MDKFFKVQKNILRTISESLLTEREKQDVFNYLFWNLAWDFDYDKYSKPLVDIPIFELTNEKVKEILK